MKKLIPFIVGFSAVVACNNANKAYQTRENTIKDSLMQQMQKKDSSIVDYVKSVNMIQKSIDTLSRDAKILKTRNPEGMTDNNTLLAQIRAIDQLMLKNRKSIADLEYKLKKSNEANQILTDLGEALSLQLNEKDSEIASIQRELVKTRASLGAVVKQLGDSVSTINQQRSQINLLKLQGNTVYYVIGTASDLKKRDIIVEAGGAVGLGRVPVLSQSTAGFMTGDLTQIHDIPLNGRFVQFVTPHPDGSYRITSGTSDKLIITDPQDFWSRSKYMVVIIK